MTIKTYRKKPVEIQASEWAGGPQDATPVIDWILSYGGTARYHDPDEPGGESIMINTLEGTMRAIPGDYIIKGVSNEFYPCKPDIFKQTYEEVK